MRSHTILETVLFISLFTCCLFADDIRTLEIVQTTDIHGSIGVTSQKPGIGRIGTAIEQIRAKQPAGNEILLIDCGDITQGTYSAALDHGASMIDALNVLKYDVFVPGNHDFDYGVPQLICNLKRFRGNVLAANLKFSDPSNRKIAADWKLIEKNGLRVAVIGIVPPYLGLWISSAQLEGCSQESPEAALQKVMPAVMNARPDLIVLAIHLGEFSAGRLNQDGKSRSMGHLAAKYPQIDLILGGHTHENVPGKNLPPNTWYVQAPALSEGINHITVKFNRTTKKKMYVSSETVSVKDLPESAAVTEVQKEIRAQTARTYGNRSVRINTELEPMKGPKTRCRTAELLCLAMMEDVGTDGAFSTTLSKYTAKPGVLTDFQIFLLAPYENYISVVRLNSDEVKAIMQEQYTLKQKWAFMVCEGVKQRKDGSMILPGGKVWNDGSRRSFAFGSYAISGAGGRYPVLKKIAQNPECQRKDLPNTVRSALMKYMKRHYPVKERGGK